jgi:hypothetical protein
LAEDRLSCRVAASDNRRIVLRNGNGRNLQLRTRTGVLWDRVGDYRALSEGSMTTALVVSRTFPFDDRMVHGIFQRLGTQVEALARVVDRVDCLFLISAHREREFSAEQIRAHEERLQRRWTPKVALTVAPVVQGAGRRVGKPTGGAYSTFIHSNSSSVSTTTARSRRCASHCVPGPI